MKKLVLLLAFLTFSFGFSQTEKTSKLDIAKQIKTAFNNSDYSLIYDLYSTDFKSKKTLQHVTDFFTRFKNSSGKITKINSSYNEDGFTKFPIELEHSKRILVIKYNAQNNIDYLSINK